MGAANPLARARAIGFSGYAKTGKTTAASYVEARYGLTRKHIAEPLRRMLASLLKDNGLSDQLVYRYLEGDLKESVIPELGVTSRHLQITLGTEWGRVLVSPDIWSQTWLRTVGPDDRVMNDSVRFPNEQAAIGALGGLCIMITRDGVGPAAFKGRWDWQRSLNRWLHDTFGWMGGVHDSERLDRLRPDVVIENNGSIEELYAALDQIMADYGYEPITQN